MRGLILLGWVLLLVFLLWPVLRWLLKRRLAPLRRPALRDELVKDPVCQTYIVRSRAVTRAFDGRTYYFCSSECVARFVAEGKA
jgi:YHS domain-containing protein